MSRHDLTLAQESCRGHRTFNPLLTAYSIALSIQQSYHVCYLVNLQYPILLLHLWPAVLYHLASGGYNTPDTMPSTWTGLKGVKLGKAPPAWRPQGLQGGRLCLPCNPSDERYLHYHQFWLNRQHSICSKLTIEIEVCDIPSLVLNNCPPNLSLKLINMYVTFDLYWLK